MSEATRYGQWAKDRPSWFFGMTGPALSALMFGGAPILLAVSTGQWLLAAGLVPVWALLVVGVALPIRGRSAARWLGDVCMAKWGAVMGWSRWQSKAASGESTDPGQVDLPGVLSGIRTFDGPAMGALMRRPVLVQDHAARTWAVVARFSHPGIGLAESSARERMAAGLSRLAEAAAAGELVSLLAVQIRTVPDDGAERRDWVARNTRADAPPLAVAVNRQLSTVLVQAGVRHEAFITVVVPEDALSGRAKEAGGGVDGRARVLAGVMTEVENGLTGALGCSDVEWLTSAELAEAIRTGFAPGDRAGLVAARIAGAADPSVAAELPMALAGPSAAPAAERRHYSHDAWSTVTATILLPDQGAVIGALAPVYIPSAPGERRCVTTFFEPINRTHASRVIGRESMSAGTAAEMKRRLGFAQRAGDRRDAARVVGQDVRLAEGRALVRVAIAAATTVPSTWAVGDYGSRLEADIRSAGFNPLRLDLAQDAGFAAACVPLGVGLPKRRVGR